MRVKTDYPRKIREIENIWIPMSDGTKLAARIWLPIDVEDDPVPAILEYLPYRKDDDLALYHSTRHPYFAGHGYAVVCVDMRGSGASDGILYDEYLPQEQDDAMEVLAWIGAQPWCTGNAGMIGISWGGFNALQVAARRPPELKAIITMASTDDRYADDVHYMGGCVLAADMLGWAGCMLARNGVPPDPLIVGERWREMWLERLEQTPPFIEAWLSHQRRDAYWKHASVCENYADITCAVYAVCGYTDLYTNTVLRLLEGLPGPRKGLLGPWSHNWPHEGEPGPNIGFLQECLRWWDYWLKGIETGIMDEPMLKAWLMESVEPSPAISIWPGRWVAEPVWPSPDIIEDRYYLSGDNSLRIDPAPRAQLEHKGAQVVGRDAGETGSSGRATDLPPDQAAEDGMSLTFTSATVKAPVDILGLPEVTLRVASNRPNALIAVRLCDVAPTGTSALVTRGLLNLTHWENHEYPTPLEPGTSYIVKVRLKAVGYTLPAGHRWRVAVSPTYWPWAWPSPEVVTLSLFTGEVSQLVLPVRPPRSTDAHLEPFQDPEMSSAARIQETAPSSSGTVVRRDVGSGTQEISLWYDRSYILLENGLETVWKKSITSTIVEGNPLSARVQVDWTIAKNRGEWRNQVHASSIMTGDAENFMVTSALEASEGNTRIFARTRTFLVPRDLI